MGIASATRDAAPARAVRVTGWTAAVLGTAGLVVVAAHPAPLASVLAGTAGIAAASAALAVLQVRGRDASIPYVGIVTGGLAALLLVAQLGATLLVGAPGLSAPRTRPAAVAAVPTRAALAGSVSTLAYLLAQARGEDGAWPAGLAVTDDGRIYATSGPNVGHLLLQAPEGATVAYSVSGDRSRCVLVMRAAADPGVEVRFSSTTGLSTND